VNGGFDGMFLGSSHISKNQGVWKFWVQNAIDITHPLLGVSTKKCCFWSQNKLKLVGGFNPFEKY